MSSGYKLIFKRILMKKNTFNFPLSFNDIAKILDNQSDVAADVILDVEGVILLKKPSNKTLEDCIEDHIFKNVYEEWKHSRSALAGDNHLLTEVRLLHVDIKEQSKAFKNYQVLHIVAKISIQQEPEFELDDDTTSSQKSKLKLKK